MSDGSGVGSVATPPRIPRPPLRGVLGGFAIDMVLAIVIGLALMFACGMAWGLMESVRLTMAGVGPEAITAALQRPTAITQLIITMLGMGGVAALLYVWRRRASAQERRQSLVALKRPGTWGWVLATAVGVFVFSSGMSWLGQWLGIPPNPSNLDVIREAVAQTPWFVMLFAILLAPLYEEVLFRRVLFGRLWQAGYPVIGAVLSGVLFAFTHEVPGISNNSAAGTLLLLFVYAVMGMAFAWVYRRTGTIWAAVAVHALNNTMAMGLLSSSI